MSTTQYLPVIAKNVLLAITAFLLVNIFISDSLGTLQVYQDIFFHAFIYGSLVGIAAAINEILIDKSIQKKAGNKKLLIEKVQISFAPLYYIRLMRVFVIGSGLCLGLIGLIFWADNYSLVVYTQLAILPVSLALGANVPQTYSMYIRLDENRQEVLNVIQQTLHDSIFEVEFKDRHHLVYKIADQWQHLYAYCFAPDRCTIEMLVHRNYVEIVGSYRYLEALMDDEYIKLISKPTSREDKKEKVA